MKKIGYIFVVLMTQMFIWLDTYAGGGVKIYKNGSYKIIYAEDIDSIVFCNIEESESPDDYTVSTLIIDSDSQPIHVGGYISNYDKANIKKKGIIVSKRSDNMFITDNTVFLKAKNTVSTQAHYEIKDIAFFDCTSINEEEFSCALICLLGNTDYYVKSFIVTNDNSVSYGNIEKIHTHSYNRYPGRQDIANVWYAFNYTLFDLISDEVIDPNNGFYYSTNENPTKVSYQTGTGYNTCYKFATTWNYKLWFYHNELYCDKNKIVSLPVMRYKNGKLEISKASDDVNKNITIYYSINGDGSRPENFTEIYTEPLNVAPNSIVYCYAISSDGYMSFTNRYVVIDSDGNVDNSSNRLIDGFGKVADAIDLGLSVKWASWNLGAYEVGDYGGMYGAGDPSGLKKSTSPSDYYFYEGGNICGTSFDIAFAIWGKPWRLPTYNELIELRDKCTWVFDVMIGNVLGCKAIGPNGNSIFIPYSGHRVGEVVYERENHSSIWSGEMGVVYHPNGYWDLDINRGGGFQTDGCDNFYGQSVRPVCEY